MHALRCFLVSVFLLTAWSVEAYIPNSRMILSRTAKNHGRGIYVIEQDVQFPVSTDALVTRETWTIKDGDLMHLKVEGGKQLKGQVYFEILYTKNRRYYLDSNGKRHSSRWTKDFIEPFFHYRSFKGLAGAMVRADITPRKILSYRAKVKDLKGKPEYPDEKYLRLTRTRGTVTFGFGEPTPHQSKSPLPGLWVEQDNFVLRRLRLPSLTEVYADEYSRHSRGLWFPRLRTINWDDFTAQIAVRRVKSVSETKRIKKRFETNMLGKNKNDKRLQILMPQQEEIRQFYSRLR